MYFLDVVPLGHLSSVCHYPLSVALSFLATTRKQKVKIGTGEWKQKTTYIVQKFLLSTFDPLGGNWHWNFQFVFFLKNTPLMFGLSIWHFLHKLEIISFGIATSKQKEDVQNAFLFIIVYGYDHAQDSVVATWVRVMIYQLVFFHLYLFSFCFLVYCMNITTYPCLQKKSEKSSKCPRF